MDAQQCVKLTGTNRSIGLLPLQLCPDRPASAKTNLAPVRLAQPHHKHASHTPRRTTQNTPWTKHTRGLGRPGGSGEGHNTRSHPELGRENPQRRWYCVSRRGRVGRRQVCQTHKTKPATNLEQTAKHPPKNAGQNSQPNPSTHIRGVEQPGSSSGS